MSGSSRNVAIVVLVAGGVALAGCGQASTPVPGNQPAATAPAVSSPAPATLTIEQAGQVYLKAVAPVNKLVFAVNAETERAQPRMDRVRDLGRQLQAAERAFLDVLNRTAWPASVQPAVDRLSVDVAAGVSHAGRLATARTAAEIPPPEVDTGSAQLVRAKLGLGVVPES